MEPFTRKFEPLTVKVLGQQVVLEQSYSGEDHAVSVTVEQVPLLIEWIQEAKAEIARS